ncbi:MAG: amidohydrolase [Verrucomicrobiales bacterium]|nr:amidohydrolase [Verrucomicrobiales bacterium]|tara:strand:+ start:2628 stop:3500 length:873 start_codon:yes stop_codon:yes gene_type:complete
MPTFRPELAGLTPRKVLENYRIWDSYFTPSHSSPGPNGDRLIADIERSLPIVEQSRMERLCLFPHVGPGTTDQRTGEWLAKNPKAVQRAFDRWPKLLLGMIQLNAADVRGSLEALDRWLRDGPMLGVYFPSGMKIEQVCSHRNFDRLVERIAELKGVIMQHTWFTTGGKSRPGQSTPSELAELAGRHPSIQFICAHAGGEWEKGIRAVRPHRNILVETSGFDATAGFVDMAVRELGAERVVFGSHLPSRSLGTELGKVIAAGISESDKKLILGTNYRALLRPVMEAKGME